jgi:hypothetical protein
MAIVKISDLPEGNTTLSNQDNLVVVDTESSTTKKVTVSHLKSFVLDDTTMNDLIDARLRHHGLIP